MRKIIYIVLISLVAFVTLASPFYIKVKTECRTQYGKCPVEIASKFDSNKSSLISAKKKANKLLNANLFVVNYRTQFKLPGILLIDIVVKKPIFAIHGRDTAEFALINKEGTVLSTASETGLPTIEGVSASLKVGDNVSPQDLFALKLLQGIHEMYQVRNGVYQDGSLVVELPSQIRVLLPVSGDLDLILGTLHLVYSKIVSEEQSGKYTEIDLRFKNPVIR